MHWQDTFVLFISFLQLSCKWKTFLFILSFGDFLHHLTVLLWRSPKICFLLQSNLFSSLTNSCLSRIQLVKYRWWFSWVWHFDVFFSWMYFLGLCRLYFKCKYTKKAEKNEMFTKTLVFCLIQKDGLKKLACCCAAPALNIFHESALVIQYLSASQWFWSTWSSLQLWCTWSLCDHAGTLFTSPPKVSVTARKKTNFLGAIESHSLHLKGTYAHD